MKQFKLYILDKKKYERFLFYLVKINAVRTLVFEIDKLKKKF